MAENTPPTTSPLNAPTWLVVTYLITAMAFGLFMAYAYKNSALILNKAQQTYSCIVR